MCWCVDDEASKMKLLALAVVLSCCMARVYCDLCSASQVETVQEQWEETFGDNAAQLRLFGQRCYERSAPF